MKAHPSRGVLAAATLALSASVAVAQSSSVATFDVERLLLNPAGRDGLLVGGGDVLDFQAVRLGLMGHYQHDSLVVFDERNVRAGTLLGSRVMGHLYGAYGVHRFVELGLQLPIVFWQGGTQNLAALGINEPRASAVGSPWIHVRSGLFRERDGSPMDLSLELAIGIPVGDPAAFSSDNEASVIPRFGLARTVGDAVRLAFEMGGWFRPSRSLASAQDVGNSAVASTMQFGFGASTLGPKVRFEGSLRLTVPVDGQAPAGELLAGVRVPVGPVELHLLGGPGFGRVPGTPAFRVLGGFAFGSVPPAEVKPVEVPKCVAGQPHEPAECPELDLDGDGIVNKVDACVTVAGVASAKGCPDADGDGLTDAEDRCPKAAGPAAQAGCPDTDGDGVHDGLDGCVTEAGPVSNNGCPLPDADGDGVPDAVDLCPAEKGVPEKQGCPPDRDGDGVIDARDSCIDVPGTKENDGCPKRTLVKIEADRLVIREKVFFDTNKATIQKRSFKLLDSVAEVLLSHPEVAKVYVDGHTDSRGKADANRKLSQDRADSVKAYLMQRKVASERLEPRGFGPDKPIADNKTAAGREQNRRVEFVIETGTTVREVK